MHSPVFLELTIVSVELGLQDRMLVIEMCVWIHFGHRYSKNIIEDT